MQDESSNTQEVLALASKLKQSIHTFERVVQEDKEEKDKKKEDPEALLEELKQDA